jgi:repressor of nif and glnA expression
MKIFFILFFTILLLSGCSKDNGPDAGNDSDTPLTREELFAMHVAGGLLQLEDEDLQEYLQTEVYPLVSASQKVFANRESSTEFSIFYEGDGKMNIITIRKFYDAAGESVFFEMSEPEVLNIDEND